MIQTLKGQTPFGPPPILSNLIATTLYRAAVTLDARQLADSKYAARAFGGSTRTCIVPGSPTKPTPVKSSSAREQAVEKVVTVEHVGEFTLKGIRGHMSAYNVASVGAHKVSTTPMLCRTQRQKSLKRVGVNSVYLTVC
jgi:hypothetical protein